MVTSSSRSKVAAIVVAATFASSGLIFAQECPELVGEIPGDFSAIAVSGDYAYLGSGTFFLIVNVSDPMAPWGEGIFWLQGYPVSTRIISITVVDNHAYVTHRWEDGNEAGGGVTVIDVSMPTAPFEVNTLPDLFPCAGGVAYSGGFAYVSQTNCGEAFTFCDVRVFDMANPTDPVPLGESCLSPQSWSVDVALLGDYAYVADTHNGVRVVDVSNPSDPFRVALTATPDSADAVAVSGNYAYVVENPDGLWVLDLTAPAAPVDVAFVPTPGSARDVAVSRGFAYVVDSDPATLRVIDVSIPSAPSEAGFSWLYTGDAGGVAVSGGYVYVATTGSMFIFRECAMFFDGFESGDTSAWSATVT